MAMAGARTRTDAENLKRLEGLRPEFERLKAEHIRAEGEIQRLTRELEASRELARRELGTDDEAAIGRMIEDARARNTAAVEEFADALGAIDARLKGLDRDP
jgi:glucokinase